MLTEKVIIYTQISSCGSRCGIDTPHLIQHPYTKVVCANSSLSAGFGSSGTPETFGDTMLAEA